MIWHHPMSSCLHNKTYRAQSWVTIYLEQSSYSILISKYQRTTVNEVVILFKTSSEADSDVFHSHDGVCSRALMSPDVQDTDVSVYDIHGMHVC